MHAEQDSRRTHVFIIFQALSTLKESSSSLISAFNIHLPSTPSSFSNYANHPKEHLLPVLISPTKSSSTLKNDSNYLYSISSLNSKKMSGPNKIFDFSSHKIIIKKTSELILSSKSSRDSKTTSSRNRV